MEDALGSRGEDLKRTRLVLGLPVNPSLSLTPGHLGASNVEQPKCDALVFTLVLDAPAGMTSAIFQRTTPRFTFPRGTTPMPAAKRAAKRDDAGI